MTFQLSADRNFTSLDSQPEQLGDSIGRQGHAKRNNHTALQNYQIHFRRPLLCEQATTKLDRGEGVEFWGLDGDMQAR